MATLQKIRDKGVLLVAIIGIALLAFILGDLLTSGTTLFNKTRDKAFVVNNDVISTQEYFDRVNEWGEFQKMVSGQTSLDENAIAQIREAVYQQMVSERLLDSQAKKLGLTVSKEEINDLVHGEAISPLLQQLPFFVDPKTGVFNRDAMMQFLSTINKPEESVSQEERALIGQYKAMWLFIENMIKYQRLEEKYNTLLANAVMVNDMEAKTAFDLSQQNADMTYAVQNYFSVPDSLVSVTENEIKAFYDKHKKTFKMDVPVAKISYFTQEITPSDEDFNEVEAEAKKAFEQLKSTSNPSAVVADYSDMPYRDVFVSSKVLSPAQVEFAQSATVSDTYGPVRDGNSFKIYKLMDKTTAPDSVHLRMMAIPDATAMGQDSAVTHFVDSIYNEIKGGKTFAEVANSLNPQSNGGDIGWVREIDLASSGIDFVKAAFNSPVGEINRFKVPGQQVILQVEGKSSPVQKYKLAVVDMPVVVSEKTSNNVDNLLNQFVSTTDVSKKFNELAAEKGYQVMPAYSVSANDFALAQIPNSRQIVNWAVNEKKMGTVRKFDLTNLRIVARVDKVIPAGTAPLSEVSSNIRARLVNDKKAEKIIGDLNAKNLSGIDAFASAMNASVDTVKFVNFNTQNISGLGFEPALNAMSAFAPMNKVMGPVKGNLGVFVVDVTNRTKSEDATYDAKTQKNAIHGSNMYRLQMQSSEVLKRKLGVEDNRYRFF